MIDSDRRAILTDLGLVGILQSISPSILQETKEGGAKKYMAPELHDPALFGEDTFRRTPATDVYSYASLCLEVSYPEFPCNG